jgi:hypothetical protein
MWRTVGFLISFAVVIELCTLVSFVVIIGGGVQRRTAGWQVAVGVLLFSAVVQCAGMAIVVCHILHFINPGHSHVLTLLGLPLRPRLPLLGRLAPRHVLPPRDCVVDHSRPHFGWHHCQRPLPPLRGRLRAHHGRAHRAGRPVSASHIIVL